MCVCVVIPFILDVRLVDTPAGVTQKKGNTGFQHFSSAVLALLFHARKIQPFLSPSLVNREVDSVYLRISLIVLHLLGIFIYFFIVRKNPSSCDCTGIRTHVPMSEGFEATERPGRRYRVPAV